MIPRIVIAIILVNLSWPLCQAAISMTNTLGDGIGDLIRSGITPGATGSSYATFDDLSWAGLIGVGAAAGGAAAVGAIALFTGGVFAAVGAILAAVAALFFGFLALMFRRFFIATLVLLAPLALVCWAIPGMEKWAKRWWDLFIKLLLMFPFIMAMFAISDVLSVVLGDVAGNFLAQLMLVFIRFAPFALIPLTFKIAGGAFGTITGMVNDRGKGLFDKARGAAHERAKTTERAQSKALKKDLGAKSRGLAGKDKVFEKLGEQPKGRLGRFRHNNYKRGLSDEVLRAAKAEHSSEKLRQAQFALEANGMGGIDYRRPDGQKKEFTVYMRDANGNLESKGRMMNKDDALAAGVLGAKVVDQDKNNEVLLEGDLASQRAAAMYATKQGLAPVATSVIDGKAKSGIPSLNGLAAGSSKQLEQAQQASAVLQEAMQANVGSMMPKMPSYFKGPSQAFGRVEAGAFSSYDPEEVTRMIKWASDKSSFTNSDTGVYNKQEHEQAWSRIGQSVQRIVAEPAKYNASPETLKRLRNEIESAPIAGGIDSDMVDAITRIDSKTGIINP